MDQETFRKYGHEFVDWVADYLDNVRQYPVRPSIRPGDIKARLPEAAPLRGEPAESIFSDFKAIILPGMTHWQHPSWFAYFSANNSPPSILAEILTAGMGAQCMIWETSPAAEELEERVMEWLARMLKLPEGMEGVIQDSASTSAVVALVTAREKATSFRANEEGIREPLGIYFSEEAHSSIEKGVKIAGFGKKSIRCVPTDAAYAMIPQELERLIKKDKEAGIKPCCVVATVGTTSSSALDPLGPVGRICREYEVWLHVDAAYAGTAAILPEKRSILDGIENADSFVFNPHKWMLTNFDCSAFFIKDTSALIRTLTIHPEYLKTGVDSEVKNYRDWSIPLGRRFRALKLWFVLRSYGVEGIQEIIREHIRLAQMFREWVEQEAGFELMAPVPLSLVCFRLNDGRPEDALNELNQSFLDRINATGRLLMTQTSLRGKMVLRMAVGSRLTREKDVLEAWKLIRMTAADLLSEIPE